MVAQKVSVDITSELKEKFERLLDYLRSLESVLVAFSPTWHWAKRRLR